MQALSNKEIPLVSTTSIFMSQVYLWMGIGLGITGFCAWSLAQSQEFQQTLLTNGIFLILIFLAQIGLVIGLTAAIHKLSANMATGLFLAYAILTGITMSSIFIVYPIGQIANAFFVSAGAFFGLSIYGAYTKHNLSAIGSFCCMALIGLLIAMIVNFFLASNTVDLIISCCGVLIFAGLTAWDTQKLIILARKAPLDDGVAIRKGAILGALELYLDFINLFLFILKLLGNKK